MKKSQKIAILAIVGAMILSVSGCEQETKKTNNLQAVKEKIEKNKGNSPANTIRPTIRPDVLPGQNATSTQRPTQTTRPTFAPSQTTRPTYTMRPAQTNVPKYTQRPAQTTTPTYTQRPSTNTQTSGTRLPLNTTGNYSGLKLVRESDRNDFVAHEIKNSKTNRVSSLNGTEPQVKVAVDAFNDFHRNNNKFVAYKFLEFHQFDSSEVQKLKKQINNNNITEYYRVTLEIYQYDQESKGPYNDTSDDPHYLRITMYNDGTGFKRLASASMR